MATQETVLIKLDSDEALVLFEFLSREVDDDDGVRLKPLTEHDGELWALNGLQGVLEKAVSVAFSEDYKTALSQARKSLLEQCGPWPV